MALLKKKDNNYFCSNCRMRILDKEIPFCCVYCGQIFSNWEETQIQDYTEKESIKALEVKEKI